MSKKTLFERPYRTFAWVVGILLLLLVLLEGWRYAIQPDAEGNKQQISETLDKVARQFHTNQNELLAQTQELANTLQSQLNRRESRNDLYKSMQQYTQFWGAGLYRGEQPMIWTDYSLDAFRDFRPEINLNSYVELKQLNNVLIWIAHVGFSITSEDSEIPYHLYTTKRISQRNALPIGKEQEYRILSEVLSDQNNAIDFSIYDPLPASYIDYRVLRSISDDSIGVAYATSYNLEEAQSEWRKSNRFWRAVFVLFGFIILGFFLYFWIDGIAPGKGLVLQVIIIAIGWAVFNEIAIAENWLPDLLSHLRPDRISSYQMLCNFSINGLFFLAAAFTLKRQFERLHLRIQPTSFFTFIFTAMGVGIINVLSILFTLLATFKLAYSTTIPLLNLQIFPGLSTIVFYFGMGLMLWALTVALFAINQFLLRCSKEHFKLVSVVCATSVIIGLFVMQIFVDELFILNWLFNISAIYFAIIFTLSFYFFQRPHTIPHPSPLRTAAIYSMLIAIVGSTLMYEGKMKTIDAELAEKIESYTQNEDENARELTATILAQLNQNFQSLSEEDLQERQAFIQGQFNETVTSTIANESDLYSYDLKLIDSNLNLIANYSTDFNSPAWVNQFNLQGLKAGISIEQITRSNIRPVIQQPELIDEENYQTFYRGWIPIFSNTRPEPIAWILCSVYKERPDFNKPMRAMLAFKSYDDWQDSYVIQEYTNNKLKQTIYLGVNEYYPLYNVLQIGEENAIQEDSTIYYTSGDNERTYRNLLSRQSENTIIKNTTQLPSFQNTLFSFFRLSFTLFVTGFLILVLYRVLSTNEIALFGKNERFQYRILDSFLLATLLFLTLLIIGTHFAIQRQNTNLVEEQLFEKLETITRVAEQNPIGQSQLTGPGSISLDSLTTALNVDASLYSDRVITESTAPQIYEQHLLPYALPYPVYRDLYLNQKRDALTEVTLGGQTMLIGYRSILANEEPIGTIAIPTFIESPKFNKQLLETTSYLIILYLVVFGIFIIGTFFISKQLTRPLVHIQRGLNKISRGNLNTTIPSTSNDEIGELATAYNQMVNRLRQLQKELAAAEREAAWKEMAQQVAHEIKNPLTPMKLNIQHLERQLASGDHTVEELKEKVETITQNLIVQIQTLNNIASDFSNFSKPIEAEFKEVNMNELVQSVADLYKHDEQTTIKVDCHTKPATVYGAEDELRRVIINLVKNAHESMPKGGEIALEMYHRKDHLFIKVEDNGQGISEEDKPKIFVPNFSTKSSGTGLGLALCKKIIESHDGSISFASIEGEGTTFVIKLPLGSE